MKNTGLCTVFLALLAASATSCSGDPNADAAGHGISTTEQLEPFECGEITRLHTYDGVFLASQPQPADFEQASKNGVKTVINLRHEEELTDFDEREVVTALGLEYINLPWNGADELSDEVFDSVRNLLSTAERPILMHCSSANRVGAVWVPWRVLDGGLSFDEALAEAKVIGMKTPAYGDKALGYIELHGASVR